MPGESISCPYCNAFVAIPEAGLLNQKVACPRCGESFSFRGPTDGGLTRPTANATAAGMAANDRLPRSGTRRLSNRAMAAGVLGLMLLMGLISLLVGLKTVPFRRSHDPQDPLAYLPADTNVIALVQVQQALQEVPGRQLLSQLYLGAPGVDLGLLEQWTGLRRDDIQTVVLGLHVGADLIPRLTLVVQTQVPYDERKLPDNLKDATRVERGTRTLYRVPLRTGSLSVTLWYAADSIVIICLTPDDFDLIPDAPSGAAQFPAPLQAYIRDRIGPEAQAWIIGHSDHWDETIASLALSGLASDYPELFADLGTWGFTANFDKNVTVSGAFEMKSERAAQRLSHYLTRHYFQRGSLTTLIPTLVAFGVHLGPVTSLGVAAVLAGAEDPVRVGPGTWVSFRIQTQPAALLEVLRHPLPSALSLPGH